MRARPEDDDVVAATDDEASGKGPDQTRQEAVAESAGLEEDTWSDAASGTRLAKLCLSPCEWRGSPDA